ncbi:MAG: hypothetical protein OXI66_15810 [Boseongicola sp.]|nr:hypothetical protein [Boseongicola sp.]
MGTKTSRHSGLVAAFALIGVEGADPARAQSGLPNLDHLSPVEDAVAVEIGDVTLTLIGAVETRYTAGSDDDEDNGLGLIASLGAVAMTQLPNRWRVELSYAGQFVSDESLSSVEGKRYTDDAALSVGGVWGTVSLGNVSETVRDQTRRRRGFGNAVLAFDDFHGERADRSAGYAGRVGPFVASGVVDDDSNVDLGLTFQRPIGNGSRDYRVTFRAGEGAYEAADETHLFTSRGFSVVGEVVYGSTLFDVGLGQESFSSSAVDATRWYVSSGFRRKIMVWGLSLEGHYGQIDGQEEVSAALGIQYDLARGLSANFGLNYENAEVALGEMKFLDSSDTKAVFSLTYRF